MQKYVLILYITARDGQGEEGAGKAINVTACCSHIPFGMAAVSLCDTTLLCACLHPRAALPAFPLLARQPWQGGHPDPAPLKLHAWLLLLRHFSSFPSWLQSQ